MEIISEQLPSKLFVILIFSDGDRSEVFGVKRTSVRNVDDLCDQVKAICSNTLANVERVNLRVFANEEEYRSDSPLRRIDTIHSLIANPSNPLIVVDSSESSAKRSRIRAPSGDSFLGGVSVMGTSIPFVSRMLSIASTLLECTVKALSSRGMVNNLLFLVV